MPRIIKDNAITESEFAVTDAESATVEGSNQILPLAFYLENKATLTGRNDIGVWLEAGEDIETLGEDVHELPIIALNFPTFSDGRSYSNANVLRRTLNYQGEVRAIGDVRRDQINNMVNCGFNAFEPAAGQDADKCLQELEGFSENYQSTITRPEPLFRRR